MESTQQQDTNTPISHKGEIAFCMDTNSDHSFTTSSSFGKNTVRYREEKLKKQRIVGKVIRKRKCETAIKGKNSRKRSTDRGSQAHDRAEGLYLSG
jgi:hypothetical protein